MSVADVLHRAADLIERRGWRQGAARMSNRHCYCALDALEAVCSDRPGQVAAFSVLIDTLGVSSLTGWNDTPGRTKAEVVAAFRDAAERAA